LAFLVSTKLRAGGSRHASEPRQLPSKPCRPHWHLYFSTLRKWAWDWGCGSAPRWRDKCLATRSGHAGLV